MSKRDDKIHALRIATAAILYQIASLDLTEGETFELFKIAERLEERAVKMGGPFNPYTGGLFEKNNNNETDIRTARTGVG
jgi:hypothetical protein